MLKMTMGNEVKLIVVAIVCALLLILGHVLLAKAFADMAWAEYTTAAIPFVMMAICGLAIKYASNQDVDQRTYQGAWFGMTLNDVFVLF